MHAIPGMAQETGQYGNVGGIEIWTVWECGRYGNLNSMGS